MTSQPGAASAIPHTSCQYSAAHHQGAACAALLPSILPQLHEGTKLNPVGILHCTAGGLVIALCWWDQINHYSPAKVQLHMLPDELNQSGLCHVCMLELLHQTCLQRMQQLRVLLLLRPGSSRCFVSLLLLQRA